MVFENSARKLKSVERKTEYKDGVICEDTCVIITQYSCLLLNIGDLSHLVEKLQKIIKQDPKAQCI